MDLDNTLHKLVCSQIIYSELSRLKQDNRLENSLALSYLTSSLRESPLIGGDYLKRFYSKSATLDPNQGANTNTSHSKDLLLKIDEQYVLNVLISNIQLLYLKQTKGQTLNEKSLFNISKVKNEPDGLDSIVIKLTQPVDAKLDFFKNLIFQFNNIVKKLLLYDIKNLEKNYKNFSQDIELIESDKFTEEMLLKDDEEFRLKRSHRSHNQAKRDINYTNNINTTVNSPKVTNEGPESASRHNETSPKVAAKILQPSKPETTTEPAGTVEPSKTQISEAGDNVATDQQIQEAKDRLLLKHNLSDASNNINEQIKKLQDKVKREVSLETKEMPRSVNEIAPPKLNIPLINTGLNKNAQNLAVANANFLDNLRNKASDSGNIDATRERDLALTKEILQSRKSFIINDSNAAVETDNQRNLAAIDSQLNEINAQLSEKSAGVAQVTLNEPKQAALKAAIVEAAETKVPAKQAAEKISAVSEPTREDKPAEEINSSEAKLLDQVPIEIEKTEPSEMLNEEAVDKDIVDRNELDTQAKDTAIEVVEVEDRAEEAVVAGETVGHKENPQSVEEPEQDKQAEKAEKTTLQDTPVEGPIQAENEEESQQEEQKQVGKESTSTSEDNADNFHDTVDNLKRDQEQIDEDENVDQVAEVSNVKSTNVEPPVFDPSPIYTEAENDIKDKEEASTVSDKKSDKPLESKKKEDKRSTIRSLRSSTTAEQLQTEVKRQTRSGRRVSGKAAEPTEHDDKQEPTESMIEEDKHVRVQVPNEAAEVETKNNDDKESAETGKSAGEAGANKEQSLKEEPKEKEPKEEEPKEEEPKEEEIKEKETKEEETKEKAEEGDNNIDTRRRTRSRSVKRSEDESNDVRTDSAKAQTLRRRTRSRSLKREEDEQANPINKQEADVYDKAKDIAKTRDDYKTEKGDKLKDSGETKENHKTQNVDEATDEDENKQNRATEEAEGEKRPKRGRTATDKRKLRGSSGSRTRQSKKQKLRDSTPPVTAGGPINKKFVTLAMQLIANISFLKFASPFLTPVNENDAPNYYSVIYEPRDLKTIKTMVKTGEITTSQQLQRELMLMFSNAIMYNRSDTDMSKWAVEMQEESSKVIDLFAEAERDAQS